MLDLIVRSAVPADAADIARVHTLGWQRGYAGLLPSKYLARLSIGASERRWKSQLADTDRQTVEYVAELNQQIIGLVVAGPSVDPDAPNDCSVGEIHAIYVDPGWWGSGVGHALHQQAIAAFSEAGCSEATLWVLHGNDRAINFYCRQGWKDDHLDKTEHRTEVSLREQRYRLRLRSVDEQQHG